MAKRGRPFDPPKPPAPNTVEALRDLHLASADGAGRERIHAVPLTRLHKIALAAGQPEGVEKLTDGAAHAVNQVLGLLAAGDIEVAEVTRMTRGKETGEKVLAAVEADISRTENQERLSRLLGDGSQARALRRSEDTPSDTLLNRLKQRKRRERQGSDSTDRTL